MVRVGLLSVCILALVASSASARTALYEGDDLQLYYGGYLRSFMSWQALDEKAQALMAQGNEHRVSDVAMHALIGRSEFKLSAADWFTAEVHSRLDWSMATAPVFDGAQIGAGAGVSVVPRRSLNWATGLIEDADHRLEFDIDRLLVRFYLGDVDISLGRQAVTWGNSILFAVSDIWTNFSPFDLDTSQKRGIDALRVVWGINDWVELDLIIADRGSVEDLSGGLRVQFYLSFGEAYMSALKSYEDLALGAGIAADLDSVKLRAEVMGRLDTDTMTLEVPRATLGADWFHSDSFMAGIEVHLNGFGATQSSENAYLTRAIEEPAFARGEGYLLGLLYTGTYLTYRPHDLISLSMSTMVNLLDPTALLSWSASVEVLESVDLALGGYHGLGEGLELGLSGHLGYVQLAAYF